MIKVSCAALAVALIGVGPAVAACGAHANAAAGDAAFQTAQARDGTTIREEENRRSGGTGTGDSSAPAPNTVKPQGDSQGAQTPQSGTTGAGQNQGSPPGTSSGSGSSGSPSTSGNSGGTSGGSGSGGGSSGGSGGGG